MWTWASLKPGVIRPPSASMTRAVAPASSRISASAAVARMRSPSMTSAVTVGEAPKTRPFRMSTRSIGEAAVALVVGVLLGHPIPALSVTDPRPQLPADALRCRIGHCRNLVYLGDRVVSSVCRDEARAISADLLFDSQQVAGHRPPPSPVVGDEPADPVERDRPRLVALSDGERGQQVDDVLLILLIELDNLQLAQQHVGDVERQRHALDPLGERELVAHLDPIDQDVDRSPLRGAKVELLVPIERVETLVGLVAALDQQVAQL